VLELMPAGAAQVSDSSPSGSQPPRRQSPGGGAAL